MMPGVLKPGNIPCDLHTAKIIADLHDQLAQVTRERDAAVAENATWRAQSEASRNHCEMMSRERREANDALEIALEDARAYKNAWEACARIERQFATENTQLTAQLAECRAECEKYKKLFIAAYGAV